MLAPRARAADRGNRVYIYMFPSTVAMWQQRSTSESFQLVRRLALGRCLGKLQGLYRCLKHYETRSRCWCKQQIEAC